MVPQEVFLTKGIGRHKEKLSSFEMALRDAGIAYCNLVRVSSIFPPHCKIITQEEGRERIKPGQIVFCVLSDIATNEPNRLIASSVGIAIPGDKNNYGYLSEHHSYGETEQIAGDYAEDLAAEMLATTLGIDVSQDLKWDERKEIWKMEDKIVNTMNITQSGIGDPKGLWTTVVAAAVLIL
ncbi:MAG: arginine decarboxylase, pyruvoyl-dependent [Candidatus Margulisiibacteriota bacterium]|nr:MAG: arginine decarboxylase, pyruvoyl-dependent [Candidatus Margulisbacteria bacterium GWD2_39_127]OGI02312.1 MAG: arginine decarboxylase, pyruvoyl-dependent [Candidatus Margulisbacteria bacterium GWF2_38_17]OGI11362.1 MAG: arginine decarboxylase, pyruvoyl-dependent [Candidatus Margulisbacteria bacterium GWE2_39_32]PZM81883.1 MAG: arginine decarboxylase, pyruvoyl-dependent [Candidatus Margulisiibacteriota bacterium]HAR63098.1 arginine decarboxylase, pyruvoyl-dependent [Candidatus Margulisiib